MSKIASLKLSTLLLGFRARIGLNENNAVCLKLIHKSLYCKLITLFKAVNDKVSSFNCDSKLLKMTDQFIQKREAAEGWSIYDLKPFLFSISMKSIRQYFSLEKQVSINFLRDTT